MRLVLIENRETLVSYAVYDGRVEVAEFHLDLLAPSLPAHEVEEMRTAEYPERA